MILFECGSQLRPCEVLPIYAWHCIAMSVTVRLSGCFAKKSPSRTGKMDQNGSKWIKMDQNGSKWLKMAQNGSKWIKMDQNGSTWILTPRYGSDGPDMPRYILDIFWIYLDWLPRTKIRPRLDIWRWKAAARASCDVWHIEKRAERFRMFSGFSQCFNVLSLSQFISVYSLCSCCAAVLLCSCCALFARCFLSLSFPAFLLLIPSFVSSSFLHFHYIHIPCLVSWCKKRWVLKQVLKQVLKRVGVLESWSLGFQVQI